MGLTRSQILRRVELPLALPAISAGIRIAVVTTISLATVAAYITPYGLGKPIFDGLQINYRTEYVVAGLLAIALALVADALLVVVQRQLMPWARRGATA
jgi:osmoprotectant transport system permease protein